MAAQLIVPSTFVTFGLWSDWSKECFSVSCERRCLIVSTCAHCIWHAIYLFYDRIIYFILSSIHNTIQRVAQVFFFFLLEKWMYEKTFTLCAYISQWNVAKKKSETQVYKISYLETWTHGSSCMAIHRVCEYRKIFYKPTTTSNVFLFIFDRKTCNVQLSHVLVFMSLSLIDTF